VTPSLIANFCSLPPNPRSISRLPCTRTSPNPGDEFMLSMRPFELQAPATIFSPGRKLLWNTRTESIHGDVGAFAKYRDRGSERAAVECRWDVSSLRDPVMSGTLPQAQCSRPGQKRGGKVGYPTAVVPVDRCRVPGRLHNRQESAWIAAMAATRGPGTAPVETHESARTKGANRVQKVMRPYLEAVL